MFTLNIAICSTGELFGGIERHILGLLSGLRERGITPLLILFHDGELAIQAREQGFEPIILSGKNHSLLNCLYLANIINKKKIQIIHVHGYKATVFCALARYWYLFAMIKTEHGLPEPIVQGSLRAIYNKIYHFLDRAATRLAQATVCYVTQDILLHYQHIHAGLKTIVIPNGINAINKNRLNRPIELNKNWFNLTIIGRLDAVKGHHLAIQAIANDHSHTDSHLHIIGTGPCEAQLKELAKQLNILHRIHFLGFRRNIYDYIAYCHALLIPSLHEGLPYTVLEAMSLGTPVIASNVGGLAEILEDDITAILIPSGDIEALTVAIKRLRDPILRCRLGDAGRYLQNERYSLKVMTDRYVNIYFDTLRTFKRSNL